MRRQDQEGFTLIEVLVVMVVLSILLGGAAVNFQKSKVHSRNNAMRATAQLVTQALTAYNTDWPVAPRADLPSGDLADVDCSTRSTNCWDPLMSREADSIPGFANAPGNQANPEWTNGNYTDARSGFRSPEGGPYLKEWPQNPYERQFIQISRGTATPANIWPGRMAVFRYPGPIGSFRVAAWGSDDDGSVILVYQQTILGGEDDAVADCGYQGVPQCAGRTAYRGGGGTPTRRFNPATQQSHTEAVTAPDPPEDDE